LRNNKLKKKKKKKKLYNIHQYSLQPLCKRFNLVGKEKNIYQKRPDYSNKLERIINYEEI
jgi:hypothetical protein